MRSYLKTFAILLIITVLSLLWSCKENKVDSKYLVENYKYIGTEKCASCHQKEYNLYKNSDHDMAMKHADSTTVLGNFNNSTFTHFSITTKFYKKGDNYFVFTEGLNSDMQEFRIKYTFGYYPLQQYLVEFEDGRIQCLPLCWDTRPKSEGGQKWFHIYGNQKITYNNILYWTRVNQNWNYMCADCHSTNLNKNYNSVGNEYNTIWSEINVGCEACHGPGSLHEDWANKKQNNVDKSNPNKGLLKILNNSTQGNWVMNYSTGIAELEETKSNDTQLETCAPCHSHRSKIDDEIKPDESFLDNYIPSLLHKNLYFDDGQIKEEVFVYGSFLQSKMYKAGVLCTDCHQSHSTKVYLEGDQLCFRCHLPEKFADVSHHHHKNESSGARCINCHMPERTYMQIDDRRDHGFRIPRPDLTQKIGVPNVCNQCHSDKTIKWAVDKYYSWYDKKQDVHFSELFHSVRQGNPKFYKDLVDLIENDKLPPIIRATAISLLAKYPERENLKILKTYCNHTDPLLRLVSISAASMLPAKDKRFLFENLSDSLKSIVTTAAQRLADVLEKLSQEEEKLVENGIRDYIHSQEINSDRPSTQINLGNFYFARKNNNKAEQHYEKAIELEPLFSPAYVNLADLYREIGKDSLGKELLSKGLRLMPEEASLNFSLALLEIRNGNKDKGIEYLKIAADNDQGNSHYAYIYAVALNSVNKTAKAIGVLEQAYNHNPFDYVLLNALYSFNRDVGNSNKAQYYSKLMRKYSESFTR